jgi:hypothetical protein
MMEVFVAFTKGSNVKELEQTLEAWERPGLEPVAIQVGATKFELHRRVTAESIAKGDYVLTSLGYGPVEPEFGALAEKALEQAPDAGLILPGGMTNAVICRKGVLTHWPTLRTISYIAEHKQAYSHVGYKTISWPAIHCQALAGSLPS